MKKFIFAGVAMAMAATPAFASDTDSKTFQINANVKPECSIQKPKSANFGNLAIDRSPGANALKLTTSYDNNNQNVWTSCNYAAHMTVASQNGGLSTSTPNDGPDSGDFTNKIYYAIDFTATENNGFHPVYLQTWTGVQSRTVTQTAAFHDNAQLRVVIPASVNPLRPLAGTYSDTATITVGPV